MYSRSSHATPMPRPPARRSESFHRLETLLGSATLSTDSEGDSPALCGGALGVMVRGIMEALLDAEALEKLLQESAPQQYTLELTIDALVSLLIQVSAGHRASVFAAYTADQASMSPTISTSYQALYAKLGRMDPKLSEAIVSVLRREAEAGSGKVAARHRADSCGLPDAVPRRQCPDGNRSSTHGVASMAQRLLAGKVPGGLGAGLGVDQRPGALRGRVHPRTGLTYIHSGTCASPGLAGFRPQFHHDAVRVRHRGAQRLPSWADSIGRCLSGRQQTR